LNESELAATCQSLLSLAKSESNELQRIHAIWTMGQLIRAGVRGDLDSDDTASIETSVQQAIVLGKLIESLLSDDEASIRIQAVKMLAEIPNADGAALVPLLNDPELRVRIQAALAIGRLGTESAYGDLVQLAAKTNSKHTYLRHAISAGLAGIAAKRLDRELVSVRPGSQVHAIKLAQLSKHGSKQVRLIAVIALRKLAIEYGNDARVGLGVCDFLEDSRPPVSTEAARAIYDDFSIGAELHKLAEQLGKSKNKSEAFLRRAIGANFRLGGSIELSRVAKFATDEENDLTMRLEALDAMADWQAASVLDRVTGRYRGKQALIPAIGLAKGEAKKSHFIERPIQVSACQSELMGLLDSESAEIMTASLTALRTLQIELPSERLIQILNSNLAIELRIEALNSLASQESEQLIPELNRAFDSTDLELKANALKWLAKVDPENVTEKIKQLVWIEAFSENRSELDPAWLGLMQSSLTLLGEIGTPESDQLLSDVMGSLISGNNELSPALMLEMLGSASNRAGESEDLRERLNEFAGRRDDMVLGAYAECVIGGNADRGKKIFNTHIEAQCVRCHRIGREGSTVGPNLKGVASREPAKSDDLHLLRSIVAPSAHIDPKYQTMMFLLESGKTVQGVIVRENDESIVLADAAGEEIVISVDEIEDEKKQKLSIMPEAKTLTKREIRDLVAFLNTLKK
jgi:putative heme-binding domain-containing protein